MFFFLFSSGGLRIDQPEFRFDLDRDGLPVAMVERDRFASCQWVADDHFSHHIRPFFATKPRGILFFHPDSLRNWRCSRTRCPLKSFIRLGEFSPWVFLTLFRLILRKNLICFGLRTTRRLRSYVGILHPCEVLYFRCRQCVVWMGWTCLSTALRVFRPRFRPLLRPCRIFFQCWIISALNPWNWPNMSVPVWTWTHGTTLWTWNM